MTVANQIRTSETTHRAGNGNGNGTGSEAEALDVRDAARLERKIDDVLTRGAAAETKMDHVLTAVFGNPLDSEDHGLVGESRRTREIVSSKLDKLYIAAFGVCGVLIAATVTIATSLH